MNLKTYNPVTPSLRNRIIINKKLLWKGDAIKKLSFGKKNSGGRNNQGRITSFHRGAGNKNKYRIIDFKRSLFNIPAQVKRIEYDPNRSAFIALLNYYNGVLSYIIAPKDLNQGDIIISGEKVDIKPGNAMILQNIPEGTLIHNIEINPGSGGLLMRAAGTYAKLLKKDKTGYALIRLSSHEERLISLKCMATIGIVSNPEKKNIKLGKAGVSRWLNIRPIVRGVAKNPIDHPHGGGQGKTSGGRPSVTPWGIPTKGYRTRKNKRTNKFIIKPRYKG
jgi:large subunit ribosomal protein L2